MFNFQACVFPEDPNSHPLKIRPVTSPACQLFDGVIYVKYATRKYGLQALRLMPFFSEPFSANYFTTGSDSLRRKFFRDFLKFVRDPHPHPLNSFVRAFGLSPIGPLGLRYEYWGQCIIPEYSAGFLQMFAMCSL